MQNSIVANETMINQVRDEALHVAIEKGSRQAIDFVSEMFPQHSAVILPQVSVKLEMMGYARRADVMERLLKELD